MKNQSPPLGLVIEGNSTHSAVLRLSALAEELGPVKSVAKRVARRLSNLLRVGYGVDTYEELQDARIILLRVPDASLPRIIDELCASALTIKDFMFVLCESWLPSDALQPLCDRGAQVATVMSAPSSQDKCFLIEGQLPVVRQVKRFIERSEARTLEIRAGTKHLYFAAKVLATALPLPFLADAQAALRASGITGRELYSLLEEMDKEMFRAFLNGARLTWGGPLTECSPEIAESHLRRLGASNPKLADDLKEQLAWARRKSHRQRNSTGPQE
jgi:predicted short-subunit dehydrogenase-like oxidoreductase (DUF2520 family)